MNNLLHCRLCGREHEGFYLINKANRKSMYYICDFVKDKKKIYTPLILGLPLKTIESQKKYREDHQTKLF